MSNKFLLTILGPTASGKTELAVALAQQLNAEIISADSRQVFRGMDIGTGKDLQLYGAVPYHLINIRDAGEQYHVAQFQDDFHEAYSDMLKRGKPTILCGGTGLYIQAVLQHFSYTGIPVNEELRKSLQLLSLESLQKLFLSLPRPVNYQADIGTKKRLIRAIEITRHLIRQPGSEGKLQTRLDAVTIAIHLPSATRRERITDRLKRRIDDGLLEEVQGLLDQGIPSDKLKFYGLEYKYATAYLLGEMDYPTFYQRLNTEIHRYAKRQMTFFRKMEKDGLPMHWLDGQQSLSQLTAQALDIYDKCT